MPADRVNIELERWKRHIELSRAQELDLIEQQAGLDPAHAAEILETEQQRLKTFQTELERCKKGRQYLACVPVVKVARQIVRESNQAEGPGIMLKVGREVCATLLEDCQQRVDALESGEHESFRDAATEPEPVVAVLEPIPAEPKHEPDEKPAPLLSEAWREYVTAKQTGKEIDDEREYSNATLYRDQHGGIIYSALLGNRPTNEFVPEDFEGLKRRLMEIPINCLTVDICTQGTDTLHAEIKKGKSEGRRTLHESTVNVHISRLVAFFKWCQERKYMQIVPLKSPRKSKQLRRSEGRLPWTTGELQQLIGLNYFRNDTTRLKNAHLYWGPLISMVTGTRITEVAQIMLENIWIEDGLTIIQLSDSGELQSLKNDPSYRKVTLNDLILNLGFWDYVEMVSELQSKKLFPCLPWHCKGNMGKNLSNAFNRATERNIQFERERKVFHGLRDTAAKILYEAGISRDRIGDMLGHTTLGNTVTAGYTGRTPLPEVKRLQDEFLSYDCLDWSCVAKGPYKLTNKLRIHYRDRMQKVAEREAVEMRRAKQLRGA